MNRSDLLHALQALGELYDEGALSEAQFQRKEEALLAQLRQLHAEDATQNSPTRALAWRGMALMGVALCCLCIGVAGYSFYSTDAYEPSHVQTAIQATSAPRSRPKSSRPPHPIPKKKPARRTLTNKQLMALLKTSPLSPPGHGLGLGSGHRLSLGHGLGRYGLRRRARSIRSWRRIGRIRRTRIAMRIPAVYGNVSPKVVRRIIRRHRSRFRYCYERVLIRRPHLRGKIHIWFQIEANGRVYKSRVSRTTMYNPRVERCLARRMRYLRFPRAKSGGVTIVNYPFAFFSS